MDRAEGIKKLTRLAERLGVKPGALKVRPMVGSKAGMTLTLEFHGHTITRSCDSQGAAEENFGYLVLWLGDLVKNIERRIETVEEAFYNDGLRQLPDGMDPYGDVARNLYDGATTLAGAREILERSLGRLGIEMSNVSAKWQDDPNQASLVIRLPSGRLVKKVSTLQETPRQNLVALALWLQNRAKNWERGIEKDLDVVFASNLLPAGS